MSEGPKMYYDNDADLSVLKGKKIAIIGYGIQGRAQALCLRDSGLDVVVSEIQASPNYQIAIDDGWDVVDSATAAKQADLIQILTQDHIQASVYKAFIEPNLTEGKALIFSHGFNIHYGQIVPPKNVDVFMIAPKGPGALVRQCYIADTGVPSLVAIYQDATGNAMKLALAYGKGLKASKAGILETTFAEETETDLFGEQAVLCGGVSELIMAGFDTLVEAGYQPEIAYFEVCHELGLILDLIHNFGIEGMRRRVSDTAENGDLSRGKRIITDETRDEMWEMLREVQDGSFAKEWILENMTGRPCFNALLREGDEHPIVEVGQRLRAMMPWLKKA
ncbi:MAG: ketol-acid reductoisomerase [Armatimonadia bacterium]